jgi:hypothetical protein
MWPRSQQIFQKCITHLKDVGAWKVIWKKSHTKNTKITGTTISSHTHDINTNGVCCNKKCRVHIHEFMHVCSCAKSGVYVFVVSTHNDLQWWKSVTNILSNIMHKPTLQRIQCQFYGPSSMNWWLVTVSRNIKDYRKNPHFLWKLSSRNHDTFILVCCIICYISVK